MLEKSRISTQQLIWLYANGLLGVTTLIMPATLIQSAKQDAWISALIGAVAGLGLILIWTALMLRHPRKTIVEIAEELLGKALGTVLVTLPLLSYLLWLIWSMVRELIGFFTINYPETPAEFMIVVFVAVCVYALSGGLEVIARTNDLVFPVVAVSTAALALFALPQFAWQDLQPVLGEGLAPVIAALPPHIAWPYGNAVAFLMVFPHIRDLKDMRKGALLGSMLGSFLLLTSILVSIMSLGATSAARAVYPPHFAARTTVIAGFIGGLDGLMDVLWISSSVARTMVFMYAFTLGLAQVLRLSLYRYLAIPVGALTAIGADILYESCVEQTVFNKQIVTLIAPSIYLGGPLLCLALSYLRSPQGGKQR